MKPMRTKTLAEIYLQQGHFQEAYQIFQALAEEDPSDQEIKERLKEIGERLGLFTPPSHRSSRSVEDRLEILEKWLANIQKRRRR